LIYVSIYFGKCWGDGGQIFQKLEGQPAAQKECSINEPRKRERASGQVGRVTRLDEFLAYWAIVFFGQFLINNVEFQFWQTKRLGYILGDFFAHASGHPASGATDAAISK
jgi:hypothetical protein